jgi:hypothetical protein
MGIDEINAMGAGIACGGLEIQSVVRKGSVVLCDSVTFPIEKVFVEFEDEDLAVSFEECVKDGTARIVLDEDTSINAAPKELQEEYELALVSGDEERLEGVLTELWEEYGIHAENPPVRETSGIKRLSIMHDDGVNAFGFNGNKEQLVKWMIANRFAGLVCDYILSLYD